MTRLQKKCFVATVGTHFLLIVVLFVGPGFFTSQPKLDDAKVLEVISLTTINDALSSGSKTAQPPPPTPPTIKPLEPVVQPPAPQPEPPPPQPEVKTPTPQPDPEPVKPAPTPDEPKLAPPQKPPKHEVKVDLTKKTVRKPTSKPTDNSEAENAAKEQKRLADAKRAALTAALSNIKANTSSATEIGIPGEGSVSSSRYKDILGTLFYNAWIPPNDASNDRAITRVSITIARDGTIISYRIIGPSGDARVDASVRKALERVPLVPPLPGGEKQRTITIDFDLSTKRMIG